MKRPKLLNEGSSRSHHSKTELLENDSQSQASEASHDQPKSTSSSSDDDNDDYVNGDNKEAILARKLMQTIDKNYSKPLKERITRLLLYILNFGYHVIKLNEPGNVTFAIICWVQDPTFWICYELASPLVQLNQ